MTNEEAKREAILSRWIECGYSSEVSNQIDVDGWKKVKFRELPSTKNGVFETKEDLRDGGLPTFYFRPQSIRPIETNNGWTRIEPDGSNLPTVRGQIYKVIRKSNPAKVDANIWNYSTESDPDRAHYNYWLNEISHYKPIIDEPAPIY